MRVTELRARDFRCYGRADVALADGVTVIHGPNGAGKTNLLEALYFGCTGRSCRTSNEREVVRFGETSTRVEVDVRDGADDPHTLAVGYAPGDPKRLTVDGAEVQGLVETPARPLMSVFLPDRLDLVKGPPAVRRAHLDQVTFALWPGRRSVRRSYGHALAQRNALLMRLRAGASTPSALDAWDAELARHAVALMAQRTETVSLLAARFSTQAAALGLAGDALQLSYRPRSRVDSEAAFATELGERRPADIERGWSGYGPHRDDLLLLRDARELRAYGSQGEQRLALLALQLAEREALLAHRGSCPVMLLDDVMSELDGGRRAALVERLASGGQSIITTTEAEHVPPPTGGALSRVRVAPGCVVLGEVMAA